MNFCPMVHRLHSSTAADLLLIYSNNRPFSWGGQHSIDAEGLTRELYISALKAADRGDYAPLLEFATASNE